MKYQLTIQVPVNTSAEYEATLGVEARLVEDLPEEHMVDGHDVGSGTMNIFVHTNSPKRAFTAIKETLEDEECWRILRIAYRRLSGDEYTILWPTNLRNFEVI